MKTIGVGLQKGGVGKTSISLALACELSKDSKVLLVDADPQGNATSALLGEVDKDLSSALFDECVLEDAIVTTPVERLYMIPTQPIDYSSKDRNKLRSYKKNRASEEPFVFDDIRKELDNSFDYCIFDTSPDFSSFEENIFYACDEIVPVMNPDTFSSDGLTVFFENINDFKKRKRINPSIRTIVLNNYNASYALDTNIKKAILDTQGYTKILVPQDQAFKKSQAQRLPLGAICEKKATLEAIYNLAQAIRK